MKLSLSFKLRDEDRNRMISVKLRPAKIAIILNFMLGWRQELCFAHEPNIKCKVKKKQDRAAKSMQCNSYYIRKFCI